MEIYQTEMRLKPRKRGFHLITDEILNHCSEIEDFKFGFLQIFIKHTSAGLTINENADPTVRDDFRSHFDKMVPENAEYYKHTIEGSDDMPAHIKSSLTGPSLQIPITNGELNMGTWQGIYLCEHRNSGGSRKLVLTIYGEEEL